MARYIASTRRRIVDLMLNQKNDQELLLNIAKIMQQESLKTL